MDDGRLQRILHSWPKYYELDTLLKRFLTEGEKWELKQSELSSDNPDSTFFARYFPVYELFAGTKPSDNLNLEDLAIASRSYKLFGSFSLTQFPGCCGIMVSYHAKVYKQFQKAGLGTLLNQLRMHIARYEGYTYLMATDIINNEPQRKVLAKNGWEDILKFTNHRTGHPLALSIIELNVGTCEK